MKVPFFISIVMLSLIIISCKKEAKTKPLASNTNGGAYSLNVGWMPDNASYERVYKVTHKELLYQGNSLQPTTTIYQIFTCVATTIGDTIVPQGINGKTYLYITNNYNFGPFRAYSFYSPTDSTWSLNPLGFSAFIKPVSLKMPLTVGQTWSLTTTAYGDNLSTDSLLSMNLNSRNIPVFKVSGSTDMVVNNQFYDYGYYIGVKGIVKYYYNNYNVDPGNSGISTIDQYEVVMTSCNF